MPSAAASRLTVEDSTVAMAAQPPTTTPRRAPTDDVEEMSLSLKRMDIAAGSAKRRAPDGEMYTRQEFQDFFGGLEEWDAATPKKAERKPGVLPVPVPVPAPPPAPLLAVPISETVPAPRPSLFVGNLSKKGPAARPPPGVQDLRVDRQTAFGNPFPMGADGHDEHFRDAVCNACEELLEDPLGANLDAIAAKHQLRVDGRFRNPAARQELSDALGAAEARLRAGESLRLMCWCFPKRCHADGIAQTLCRRLREAGIEVDVVGRPGSGAHDNATRSGGAAATLEVEAALSAAAHRREDGGRGCAPGRGGRGQARGRRGVSRLQ